MVLTKDPKMVTAMELMNPYEKPPSMSVSQTMRTFLYNRETGAFMGRTASSWGKRGVASFRISSTRMWKKFIWWLSMELWCGLVRVLSILSLTRYRIPRLSILLHSPQAWTHLESCLLRETRHDLFRSVLDIYVFTLAEEDSRDYISVDDLEN